MILFATLLDKRMISLEMHKKKVDSLNAQILAL